MAWSGIGRRRIQRTRRTAAGSSSGDAVRLRQSASRRPLLTAASLGAGLGLLALFALPAQAHFQELIPSADIVERPDQRRIDLDLIFTHPMANGPAMDMAAPVRFGVVAAGHTEDLRPSLQPVRVDGHAAFRASYEIRAPGDYVFFVEPAPYWEPAEGRYIIHYAKVVVSAFGAEQGWDALLGLPVEIRPLVRPYGLWTGSLFRGVVLHDGQPVPHAEIEVEYRNTGGAVQVPAEPFTTQVIRADAQGAFAFAMPRAGWWGFAALVEGPERPGPDGTPVPVELGGLMWVRVEDMR